MNFTHGHNTKPKSKRDPCSGSSSKKHMVATCSGHLVHHLTDPNYDRRNAVLATSFYINLEQECTWTWLQQTNHFFYVVSKFLHGREWHREQKKEQINPVKRYQPILKYEDHKPYVHHLQPSINSRTQKDQERASLRRNHPDVSHGILTKKTQGSMSLLTYAKQLVKVIVLTKLAVY
jgi:hypothetical protein